MLGPVWLQLASLSKTPHGEMGSTREKAVRQGPMLVSMLEALPEEDALRSKDERNVDAVGKSEALLEGLSNINCFT